MLPFCAVSRLAREAKCPASRFQFMIICIQQLIFIFSITSDSCLCWAGTRGQTSQAIYDARTRAKAAELPEPEHGMTPAARLVDRHARFCSIMVELTPLIRVRPRRRGRAR